MLPVNDGDNEIDLGIDNDNNDAHDFVPVEEHADGGNNTQENDVNQNDGNNQIDLGTIVVSDKKKCNGINLLTHKFTKNGGILFICFSLVLMIFSIVNE